MNEQRLRSGTAALNLTLLGEPGDVVLGLALAYDPLHGSVWRPSLAARVYF